MSGRQGIVVEEHNGTTSRGWLIHPKGDFEITLLVAVRQGDVFYALTAVPAAMNEEQIELLERMLYQARGVVADHRKYAVRQPVRDRLTREQSVPVPVRVGLPSLPHGIGRHDDTE